MKISSKKLPKRGDKGLMVMEYLLHCGKIRNVKEVAAATGASERYIYQIARLAGRRFASRIHPAGGRYSLEESKYIYEHIGIMTYREIGEKLGRSAGSVWSFANRNGWN